MAYQCKTEEGQIFSDFCSMLKHARGDFAGQPFHLEDWQAKYFDELLGTKNDDGLRQYRRTFVALPRKSGKQVPLDTTLITPTGKTTMGEVKVGDDLVGLDGLPCKVVAKSEVDHNPDSYEIELSSGEVIECDGNHDWTVTSRYWGKWRDAPEYRVMSTRELHESKLRYGQNWRFRLPTVIYQGTERDLPVPPYILGSWLGDGFSDQPKICGLRGDLSPLLDELGKTGWDWDVKDNMECHKRADFCLVRIRGVRGLWRKAGFLDGRVKRIPDQYMHASVSQRVALLQGLLDTDGQCGNRGSIRFDQKKGPLIEDVRALLASLGIYAKVRYYDAKFDGRVVGTAGSIKFKPPAWLTRPFRLPRKNARVKPAYEDGSRKIVAVRRTDRKVPMQCVQVVGGNYLCDTFVPTHNSAMLAALGLYMLLIDGEAGAEIIVAAGDRNQAALLHTAAKQFLESCPALGRMCKVFRNSIVVDETHSTFMTVSSDAGLKHGLNPSVVLIDEYHVFRDSELVDVLETGMGARSQPLLAYITTAGNTIGGPCHRLWERARHVQDGIVSDPAFYPCIWEANDKDDPFDIETAKKCNPNFGITTKPEYFENWIKRAKESPSDEVTYKTLHLNLWCTGSDKWLRHGAYRDCMAPLDEDRGEMGAYIGVDLSSTSDTTAVSIVWPDFSGGYDVENHIFIPEEGAARRERQDRVPYREWAKKGWVTMTEGDVIDYDVVYRHIVDLCERWDVRGIAIDRWNATGTITRLAAEGLPVKPFGQGFASMSAPIKALEAAILKKAVRFGDNRSLEWQFSNATVKQDPAGNVKLVKPKDHSSPVRIDAAVATVMGVGLALAELPNDIDYNIEII